MQVIAGGLEANDRVIVNGLLRARPGAVVNPVAVQLDYETAPADTVTVQSRPAMTARRIAN
jgi:hypothetical protein